MSEAGSGASSQKTFFECGSMPRRPVCAIPNVRTRWMSSPPPSAFTTAQRRRRSCRTCTILWWVPKRLQHEISIPARFGHTMAMFTSRFVDCSQGACPCSVVWLVGVTRRYHVCKVCDKLVFCFGIRTKSGQRQHD